MVDVKMRHDEVFDRFSRDLLFHSFDDGDRPFLEKRRFDHDHMILHFNSHAVMIASFDVAKGIYHIKGSDHHSMAVEMKDHVIMVEAPFFEERSVAVIKAVEEKIPGKPIKYLVVTHFHIDHSGGIRAYAAKGATILMEETNAPFLKTLLSRPKTMRPDSLAKAGSLTPNVEGVKEIKSLTDGERTVELRDLPNPHSSGMLMVYLPKEKILFESDLFTPGTPVDPSNTLGVENAVALWAGINNAKIQFDRIGG